MRRSDIVSGSVVALLGLFTIFVIVPAQISGTSEFGIAPDVFPLTLLWATTLFAALLVVSRVVRPPAGDGPAPLSWREARMVVVAAAFLAVVIALIAYVGFIAGGAVAIAAVMIAMGEWEHKVRLVLVSALAPTILYAVFWYLFRVPLP